MKEHVKIYTGTSIEVNRIVSILEDKGISTLLKNNIESGRLAGFGTSGESVELFVLNADVEKAKEVLKDF